MHGVSVCCTRRETVLVMPLMCLNTLRMQPSSANLTSGEFELNKSLQYLGHKSSRAVRDGYQLGEVVAEAATEE